MPRPAGEAAQQDGGGPGTGPAATAGSANSTATTGGATSPRKTSKAKPKKSLTRAPSTSGLAGPKVSTTKPPSTEFEDEDNIWGGLDPSKTLLIHGLETDWIEEEMADDDDFRKGLTSEERVLLREKKKERLMKENENDSDEGLNLSVSKNGGTEHATQLEALLSKPIEDLPHYSEKGLNGEPPRTEGV